MQRRHRKACCQLSLKFGQKANFKGIKRRGREGQLPMITVFWPRGPASARVLRRWAAKYHVNPRFRGPKIDVHARSMSMITPIGRRLDRDHEKRANEASWSSPSLILSSISFSSIISSHFVLKNSVKICNNHFSVFFLAKIVILRLPCFSTYYTLAQRCNGRYYCRAGLFGSKCDLSMQSSPLGCCLMSALSIPIGEWHNKSPADLNPITTITSMQIKTSKPPDPFTSTPPSNPQAKYCMKNVLVSLPICEIKINKRVALATNIKTYYTRMWLVCLMYDLKMSPLLWPR